MKKVLICFLLPVILFISCTTNYAVRLAKTEDLFYKKNYEKAVDTIRPLAVEAGERDKLLFLMEAGVIMHTMGEYEKSITAFKQADEIAETIKKSVSKQVLSFIVNDRMVNFTGENFERVLIKFYIALDYCMLDDLENARRYFRKADYELKEMKYDDAAWKQNCAARYIDAVIAEFLGEYNTARVEYKNIEQLNIKDISGERYVLGVKENDSSDISQYQKNSRELACFSSSLSAAAYNTNMGELVIIHQSGLAPVKSSRGRLFDDAFFKDALTVAIGAALVAQGAALSTTAVIAMLGSAENPIPEYKIRDAGEIPVISINNVPINAFYVMNNYGQTAMYNFNDEYKSIVTKNVASIATKVTAAAVASHIASKKIEEASGGNPLVGLLARVTIGATTGAGVAASIKPDLRCWRLLPNDFQIARIFLEPGEYSISFLFKDPGRNTSPYPGKIMIKPGKPVFLTMRSYIVR